jgi:hypothetical protein
MAQSISYSGYQPHAFFDQTAEADAASNGSSARSFFIRASSLGAAKPCGFLVVDANPQNSEHDKHHDIK